MKRRIFFSVVVMSILLVSSCSKTPPPMAVAGFWTFGANSFQPVSCTADSANASLTATNTVSGSSYSNIVINFYDSLPTVNSKYIVANAGDPHLPKQVLITVALMTSSGLNYYASTGGNGRNDSIAVTVTNGKLTVSGNKVELMNTVGQFDSTSLSFNLIQQ